MRQIFLIAVKNVQAHRAKTLIIGSFVALGVMCITVGFAFLESTKKSLEQDFRAHYSADAVISAKPVAGQPTLFGLDGVSSATGQLKELPPVDEVKKVLLSVAAPTQTAAPIQTAGLVSVQGIISTDKRNSDWVPPKGNDQSQIFLYLFSGENPVYWDMFNPVVLTEGSLPEQTPGKQAQILLSEKSRKKFEAYYDLPLKVGDEVNVSVYGTSLKVRPLTVSGFFTATNPDSVLYNLAYIDANTARQFAGLTLGSGGASLLPEGIDISLGSKSEDDLFASGGNLVVTGDNSVLAPPAAGNAASLTRILGDTARRDALNKSRSNSWNYLLVRFPAGTDAARMIAQLNEAFQKNNLQAVAIDWKQASKPFSNQTGILSTLFTILMLVFSFVVFIIIMNTLVVSILERTAEIGTMRAMGAKKSFIRVLFLAETSCITLCASLAGIAAGLVAIAVFNATDIKITNDLAKFFLGSGSVKMIPSVYSMIITVLFVVAGGLLANWYPVSIALKISPREAMSEE